MPIVFECPQCGLQTNVADHYAGQTGPCAGCGASVTVPGAGAPPSAPPLPPRKRTFAVAGVVLVPLALLAFVMCAGILTAIYLPLMQGAREARRREQASQNLKQLGLSLQSYQLQQIGVALRNYESTYQTFPPAYLADADGKPAHSWRVLLLPFLDEQALYDQYKFDEPWDGPHNRQLRSSMPSVYCEISKSSEASNGVTCYAAVMAPGALFDGPEGHAASEIADGPSGTIAIVQADREGLNWLEPKDLDFARLAEIVGGGGEGGSRDADGVPALMADGSVRHLAPGLSSQELQSLLTRSGGEPVDAP